MLRPGRLLVQVLIAIAIAVLVVGLFLAGIGRMRESSNRMKCANNLKQLGLAVHNYELTFGLLPPFVDLGEHAPSGKGLPSVYANLIPYIESTDTWFRAERPPADYHAHSSVVFSYMHKGMQVTRHGGVANQDWWREFSCPVDDTAQRLRDVPMTLPDGSTGYYATGSYVANGLVPWGTGPLTKAFPRGIANTIIMAERPQVCRTAGGEEVYNLWGLGFYSPHMPAFATLTPADHPEWQSTGQIAPAVPLPGEEGEAQVRMGRADAPPQSPDFSKPFQRIRSGQACDPRLPAGPHSAGMQVLMADGSVRVLDWDTSPWAFWRECVPGDPDAGR